MSKYGPSSLLPSGEELAQIKQIRDRCQVEVQALTCQAEDVVGDIRVCRFLRARHGNVDEAVEWFKDFLVWHETSGMGHDRWEVIGRSPESLIEWYSKRRNPFLPICPYAGRNDDGHVIWYIRQGFIDPVKFIEYRRYPAQEDKNMLWLLMEWTLWYLDNLSRAEGRMLYCIKIGDFAGLGYDGRKVPIFVPAFKSFMGELLTAFQRRYCEHDSLFLILNTPMLFRVIFVFLKSVLTKRQVSKVRILGDSSKKEVQQALREFVPDSILLANLGGTLGVAVGAFPLMTSAEVDEWYNTRHLLPVEAASQDPSPPAKKAHAAAAETQVEERSETQGDTAGTHVEVDAIAPAAQEERHAPVAQEQCTISDSGFVDTEIVQPKSSWKCCA
mmetsp:Transcript_3721/g.9587  ORF Transcript_3721/g.9587 Transcript_3721/m.9587 type:complete len:386 (-) Transcript_3721:333-1490(-)